MAALVQNLRAAGADEQAAALATRVATLASLEDPADVAVLLDSLRRAGAHKQAAALLARDRPPASLSRTRPTWSSC